jgi:hypothetical protein
MKREREGGGGSGKRGLGSSGGRSFFAFRVGWHIKKVVVGGGGKVGRGIRVNKLKVSS